MYSTHVAQLVQICQYGDEDRGRWCIDGQMMRRRLFIRTARRPLSKADVHRQGVGGRRNVARWWRDRDREEEEQKIREERSKSRRGERRKWEQQFDRLQE